MAKPSSDSLTLAKQHAKKMRKAVARFMAFGPDGLTDEQLRDAVETWRVMRTANINFKRGLRDGDIGLACLGALFIGLAAGRLRGEIAWKKPGEMAVTNLKQWNAKASNTSAANKKKVADALKSLKAKGPLPKKKEALVQAVIKLTGLGRTAVFKHLPSGK